MKALFLGMFSFHTAAAMRAWRQEGHEIVGFWHSDEGGNKQDRLLRHLASQWSVAALLAESGVAPVPFSRFVDWAEAVDAAVSSNAEVVISVFFGRIVPRSMLDRFAGRIVNIHPALLPRYRGPHPVVGMLIDGAAKEAAGATLHVMSEGIDEGAIIAQRPVPFPENGDFTRFRVALGLAIAEVTRAIPDFVRGEIVPVAQDEANAIYRKVKSEELTLGPARTLEQAMQLCRTLPPAWSVRVEGAGRARVRASLRVVGPPTGEAPAIGIRRIEFDLADRRVAAGRHSYLRRKFERWRLCLLLRRAAPDRR